MGPPKHKPDHSRKTNLPKSGTPRFIPAPPQGRNLDLQFVADPFNKLMREPGPHGHLVHTSLGLLLEIHAWLSRPENQPIPESFEPIEGSIVQHLAVKCPKALAEADEIAAER
jgi:hypothetical protein